MRQSRHPSIMRASSTHHRATRMALFDEQHYGSLEAKIESDKRYQEWLDRGKLPSRTLEIKDTTPNKIMSRKGKASKFWNLGIRNCYYCNIEMTEPRSPHIDTTITVDHKIPKSKGGLNSFDNLVPCCSLCNHTKGSRLELDFIKNVLPQRRKHKI
jgi:5-methylcytosine-specific restriction endonuclease McrA